MASVLRAERLLLALAAQGWGSRSGWGECLVARRAACSVTAGDDSPPTPPSSSFCLKKADSQCKLQGQWSVVAVQVHHGRESIAEVDLQTREVSWSPSRRTKYGQEHLEDVVLDSNIWLAGVTVALVSVPLSIALGTVDLLKASRSGAGETMDVVRHVQLGVHVARLSP